MTELFKENRTLLVIAHRLQVSEIADRVIVLKNGIISETGTFTNLNHPGTYFFDLLVKSIILCKILYNVLPVSH